MTDTHTGTVAPSRGNPYMKIVLIPILIAMVIAAALWINNWNAKPKTPETAPAQSSAPNATGLSASADQGSNASAGARPQDSTIRNVTVTLPEPVVTKVPATDVDTGNGAGLSEGLHIPRGHSVCPDADLGKGSAMLQAKAGYTGTWSADTPFDGNLQGDTVRFHNLAEQEQNITTRFVLEGSKC